MKKKLGTIIIAFAVMLILAGCGKNHTNTVSSLYGEPFTTVTVLQSTGIPGSSVNPATPTPTSMSAATPTSMPATTPASVSASLPSATPYITPTVALTKTAVTYEPTTKPTVTEAAEPTKEPIVTVTPIVKTKTTSTPIPTVKPKATVTPAPTVKPKATVTPAPTVKPKTTVTPAPTVKPKATATAAPTVKPTMKPASSSIGVVKVVFYKTTGLDAIAAGDSSRRLYAVDKTTKNELACSYKVNNKSIASIDEDGYITGIKPGNTSITVTSSGSSMSFEITVVNSITYAYQENNDSGLSKVDEQILSIIRDIFAEHISADMTDYEKCKAMHDYIILNTKYDQENYLNGTIPDASYLPEGVLLNHVAVCQGYAVTYALLLDLLGIENKLISGTALVNSSYIGHIWNLVKLNGEWYHIDITWDDPIGAESNTIRYQYFLLTDDYIDADHKWDNTYPDCNATEYLLYAYKNNKISSITKYEKKFKALLKTGIKEITILYPEEGMPDTKIIQKYVKEYSYYLPERMGKYTIFTVIIQ